MAKANDPGPKSDRCPKCLREVGGLVLHVRYCRSEAYKRTEHLPVAGDVLLNLPTRRYGVAAPTSYPAPFVDGPLHGSIKAPARGRHPHYLDAQGFLVPVRSAERFLAHTGKPRRPGIYALRATKSHRYWYVWIERR